MKVEASVKKKIIQDENLYSHGSNLQCNIKNALHDFNYKRNHTDCDGNDYIT